MSGWIAGAVAVVSAYASYQGAKKQANAMKKSSNAQVQAYYDSPQFQTGSYASELLLGNMGGDFDEEEYRRQHPEVWEKFDYDNSGYQHWLDFGRDLGWERPTKGEKKGLLDLYVEQMMGPQGTGFARFNQRTYRPGGIKRRQSNAFQEIRDRYDNKRY